jgi:hypothetical protein
MMSNPDVAEQNATLWILPASPTIWAAHFLSCYLTAAIWCAKLSGAQGSFWTVRVAIAAYTVVALAGIAICGYSGWRSHRYGSASLPHDADLPEDRHRFLGFATLLLSGLSAVAVCYSALAAVFIRNCE